MASTILPEDTLDAVSTITDALGNLLYLIRTDVNNPSAVLSYLDVAEDRVAALNRLSQVAPPATAIHPL